MYKIKENVFELLNKALKQVLEQESNKILSKGISYKTEITEHMDIRLNYVLDQNIVVQTTVNYTQDELLVELKDTIQILNYFFT